MKFSSRVPTALAIFSVFCLPMVVGVSSAAPVLPDAASYEYFYGQTSSTVGTLSYSGGGCPGTCSATTELGANPSVSANVDQVIYNYSFGGMVQASLQYYVEYVSTPGTYAVNLHSMYSLSDTDGQTQASEALTFGTSGGEATPTGLSNFSSVTLQQANCVNGCPAPGFVTGTGPLAPDNMVQMVANTPYLVELDVLLRPQPTNVQISALLDSTFSTSAVGGEFIFSPGVVSAVPEPTTWLTMILGLLAIGIIARRPRFAAVVA